MRKVSLVVIAWVVAAVFGIFRPPNATFDELAIGESLGTGAFFAAVTWLSSRRRESSKFYELDAPPTYYMLGSMALFGYFSKYGALKDAGASHADARWQAALYSPGLLFLIALTGVVFFTLRDRAKRNESREPIVQRRS